MPFSRLTKILIWLAVAVVISCGVLVGARSVGFNTPLDGLLAWLPKRQTSFEKQGGSQFLLVVDRDDLIKSRLEALLDDVRSLLRDAKIGYRGLFVSGREFKVQITDVAEIDAAKTALKMFTGSTAEATPVKEFALDEPELGLLRLTLTDDGVKMRASMAMARSIEVLTLRVTEGNAVAPIIRQQGDDRILVQLPGLQDPVRLKEIVSRSGKLTFQMIDTSWPVEDALKNRPPRGSSVHYSTDEPPVPYLVEDRVIVSGENIIDVKATDNSYTNEPVVLFTFDSEGKTRFAQATSQNVGKPFAIILDDQVLSAPIIREPILGGSGQISGNFTRESADDLAVLLRSGPMLAKLKIVEVRTIAPGGVQN